MFDFLIGSMDRGIDRGRRFDRHRGRLLYLEGLETRITPSTSTWTGLGGDSNWTDAANWDTPPQAGDDLVFPPSPSQLQANNDFPTDTSFGSITIEAPGYALSGDDLGLTGGFRATYTSGTSTDSIDTFLGDGTISVAAGGTLDLQGMISSTNGMSVSGGGTLDLSGDNTSSGLTTVNGAGTRLLVDGTSGDVQVNAGAVLGGGGTVGNVTSTGGIISPGHSPDVLNTGSLTLDSNSTFVVGLDGPTPGDGTTGYDQVVSNGGVSLGGARLSRSLGGGYAPMPGDQLTIIDNTSGPNVTGTFAGLLEGADLNISGYEFQITYQGGSNQQNVVLTAIAPTTTTTTISASTTTSTYGAPVTFTAHVAGGLATPTGTVNFYDGDPSAGGTLIDTALLDPQTGDAIDTSSTLEVTASPHEIFATYIPDAQSIDSGSTTTQPATLTVKPAPLTATGVTANDKVYDGTTFATLDTGSATLSGVLGNDVVQVSPTGSTAFFADKNVGTAKPVTVSSVSLSGADAGNYIVVPPVGLTASITPAPLTITANNESKAYGAPLPDLTAGYSGLVGGDTAASLTMPPMLTTSATSTSPVGNYAIDAAGASASNYTITYGSPGTLVITKASSSAALSSSISTPVVGQATTFTVHAAPVSPGAGNPTGMITFFTDGAPIGTAAVDPATGIATLSTTSIGLGTHSITASYSGDSSFQSSQSNSNQEIVSAANTESDLSVQAIRNRRGKITRVELVSQVVVVTPGGGVPAGVVTYFRKGHRIKTIAMNEGTSVLTLKSNQAMNQAFTIRYSGSASFQGSSSAKFKVTQKSLNASAEALRVVKAGHNGE